MPNKPQFCPENWEYILRTISTKVKRTLKGSQKINQAKFNELVQRRLDEIESLAHKDKALTIARKFDFMTTEEQESQYLKLPF